MASKHYKSTWYSHKLTQIQSLIDISPIEIDQRFREEEDRELYNETDERLLYERHQPAEVRIYILHTTTPVYLL
jgi:hypothetical protein